MTNGKIKLFALKSNCVSFFGEGEIDGLAIITGLLSTVYKLDKTAIDSILKHGKVIKAGETSTDVATPESIMSFLTTLDTNRVAKIKTDAQDGKYQEGYAKAKGEVLHETERAKKEKYGVTSDLKGQELDDFIIADQLKKAGKVDTANEEEVKKSSAYQQMEARLKKELKQSKDDAEAKVKELETTYKKEGTFTKVGQSALDLLTGLQPILPKNEAVAATYKKDFLNELKGFEYEEKDGKILVSKDGKLLEDGHGNTLSWEEHVKGIAGNRFEFAANSGGENAGDKNDPAKKNQPAAYPAGINKPKNDDELSKIMASDKLKPAEKRVVLTEYEGRTTAK